MGCHGSKEPPRVSLSNQVKIASSNKKSAQTEREIEAQRQRRRLSVAPDHVGDITDINKNETTNSNNNNNTEITIEPRFSALTQDHLHIVSDSIHENLHIAISKKGYVPYNTMKKNQDSFFIEYNFGNNNNRCHLFGVCDGHGEVGHFVSSLVKNKISKYLLQQNYMNKPKKALLKCVKLLTDTLRKSKINTSFSGTTLVFSLIIDNKIYTANLGDSRCVLCTKTSDNVLNAIDLSIDQKPELAEEKKRILKHNGRVQRLPNIDGNPNGEEDDTSINGPYRVWLKDIDIPGLAMSRSLGDDVAHSVGVISIPIIMVHEINIQNDLFIILASDGIWEFLSSQQVCKIINQDFPNLTSCAMNIVNKAIEKWKAEEDVIDDITAVIFNIAKHRELQQNITEK